MPRRAIRGSSPLARGGRLHPVCVGGEAGLIPARAGRTAVARARLSRFRAHPRSRGADPNIDGDTSRLYGSSPLARGGLPLEKSSDSSTGLIPARAGRTYANTPGPRQPGAHPRSRGADDRPPVVGLSLWGSSPLARGGRLESLASADSSGLIPARAGRTQRGHLRDRDDGAHPRSRGADRVYRDGTLITTGSSPLARGGHPTGACQSARLGLIPARAGRT